MTSTRQHRGGDRCGQFEHVVLVLGEEVVGLQTFGPREGALEVPVVNFLVQVVQLLHFPLQLALTVQDQQVPLELHLQIGWVHAGQRHLQRRLFLRFPAGGWCAPRNTRALPPGRARYNEEMKPAARARESDPRTPVLAIDYGRRRIGLAISDALGLTARPLATLERTNRRDDLRRLREVVRAHEVRRIIVGNPLHIDGSSSEMAEEARRFAHRVGKNLGLPVELVDERLSSWEAAQLAPRARARSRKLDQVAAAVILRDYLGHTRAAEPHKSRARVER